MINRFLFVALMVIRMSVTGTTCFSQGNPEAFRNSSLPVETRLADLMKRLTLEEKISLLGYQAKAVKRLGIEKYVWWNEALHGVARAGSATIFPQAIAMAASFDDVLLKECAQAISTEARAKFNIATAKGQHLQYMGLTFWSPNINIFRDPRWGRGQETYGEDPFLTAVMGTAFVHGMQGDDPNFLKTAACAKHFAVHSGPESLRHGFNALIGEKDLRETYLYAFHKLVDAGVESVMCAYNRVNGEPCCTGQTLLRDILRNEWKFRGQVVTDCYALQDIYEQHHALPNSVAVAAAAVKAGVNVDCSNLLQDDVLNAIRQNILSVRDVDDAVAGALRTEFRLGLFDKKARSKYSSYNTDSVANAYHASLARKMAQESMVLLKNEHKLLPLDASKYNALMVVGPNATSLDAMIANYHGVSGNSVTFLEGIANAVDKGTRIEYDMGCDYRDSVHFGGIWAASNAEVTIAVLGLTSVYEGEEGDAFLAAGGGDRVSLSIPASHVAFLKALRKGTHTPIVLVLTAGSAIDIDELSPYADAIILAWYPGEQAGNALADILFGKVNPAGRLPVTFYKHLSDIPDYKDYAMRDRTYRYYGGEVQFPFGFGMSYTSFAYEWVTKPAIQKDSIIFWVRVSNTSERTGDEVTQVYIGYPERESTLQKELRAFRRITVRNGTSKEVRFSIPLTELSKWDTATRSWRVGDGDYRVMVGASSADIRLSQSVSIDRKN